MKEFFKLLGIIFLLLIGLYISYWLITYKFRDCRKVGHTFIYCLMDM